MNNLMALSNMQNMMAQINQLKNQFIGKRPEDIINEMLKNGQINQAQLEQAKQMAQQFRSVLK